MHQPIRHLLTASFFVGYLAAPASMALGDDGAIPAVHAASSPAIMMLAASSTEPAEKPSPDAATPKRPVRTSSTAQRKRAAGQKQLLLQEQNNERPESTTARQLERLRQQQEKKLREQREIQHRDLAGQHQAVRRLQETPSGQAQPPRLGPVDRPLIERNQPGCGIPNRLVC